MPRSVTISFGTWEEQYNSLTPEPDGIYVQLTYINDVDGPDYDFTGLLQVKTYPFVISQSFTYHLTELTEFYESLRALHAGQTSEARLTNILESFSLILRPADANQFSVCVELDIAQASASPLVISGFATEQLGLIRLMRRVWQSLQN